MTAFNKGNLSDFYPENIHQRIHRMARKPKTFFFLMIIKKVIIEIQKVSLQ